MKIALIRRMNLDRRRTSLFLLCAVVLLGAGFAWGYGTAYGRFYSSDAVLDRELVHLDFDSRVLHHINAGQRVECRRDLVTQLQRESTFLRGLLESASADARNDANRKLQQAEGAINGQPVADGGATQAATAKQ